MNIIKRVWKWLTTKHESETMSESTTGTTATAETVTAQTATIPAATQTTTTTVTSDDSVLDRVKTLLVNIGHDVEAEWDAVVALAKTLVAKSN